MQLLQTYLTDILDVLTISVLLYSLLIFLRRASSYLVLAGITIVLGFYLLAKGLHLELTLLALQYFVGASVVILAIIFQAEIRKYVELLGLIGTRQLRAHNPLDTNTTIITELIQACAKMSQEKTGALIVVQGKDFIDSFIDGGVQLDGVISEEVLLSIFDPHSEGHDGALIISNNRILKFGTHLPLSTNFIEIGKHGTRHSAAVGLSEKTDALCILVSEEKGTISVCRKGKLKQLDELADLEKELAIFIKAKSANTNYSGPQYLIRHNFWLKTTAVALASAAWLLKNS